MAGESAGPGERVPGRGDPRTTSPSAVPSVAQVRAVCQPPEVLARPVEHWTAAVYLRRVSPHLTRHLIRLRVGPDAVTGLMIATGLLLGPALAVPGAAGIVLVVLLGQLQMLLDCCDGEVARWYGRSSATGVFLDKLGHHAAEASLLLGLGVRVWLERGGGGPGLAEHALALGAVAALLVVLNRAVNDMVHAARAAAGLGAWSGSRAQARPAGGVLARLRRAAGLLPLHRLLHSVELTLLVAGAAGLAALSGAPVLLWLLAGLVPAAGAVLVGHVAAVLGSARLRPAVDGDGSVA